MAAVDLLAPRRRRHEERAWLDAQQVVEELQRLRGRTIGGRRRRAGAAHPRRGSPAAASNSRCRCSARAGAPAGARKETGDELGEQAGQLGQCARSSRLEARVSAAERSQATTGP